MAHEYVKISELEPTTSFGTTDQFVIVQNDETVKIVGADLVQSLATLTNLATRSYVDAVVDSAPGTLDTLRELAAALNDDANFGANITALINEKLPISNFGLEFWNQLATVNSFHISEGSNLYWTQDRFDEALASKNTYHLAEGSNLYFTNDRARASLSAGEGIDYNSTTGVISAPGLSSDPTFNSVATTTLNVKNVNFTGTGAVTISSGNDLNLVAAGNVAVNGKTLSNVAFSGAYADLTSKPTLSAVATSGSYTDLTNKPLITWALLENKNNASGPSQIALGKNAGLIEQSELWPIAIGQEAGKNYQGEYAIAIGYEAGYTGQNNSIAIGAFAGRNSQSGGSIAIGTNSGQTNQGITAISIGWECGQTNQGEGTISIGAFSGHESQGNGSIAIGRTAGQSNQGTNSIAIGNGAGTFNQPRNTIIINATGDHIGGSGNFINGVPDQTDSLYIAPIRDTTPTTKGLFYNTTTREVTIATLNTNAVAEASNLYYTDARVGSYLTSNNYATQDYVGTQIANLVNSAPTTLDTLNELATALGNDANFATTVTTALGTKLTASDFNLTFDNRLATKSTTNLAEGTNLYYTDTRARSALSSGANISYNNSTGVIAVNGLATVATSGSYNDLTNKPGKTLIKGVLTNNVMNGYNNYSWAFTTLSGSGTATYYDTSQGASTGNLPSNWQKWITFTLTGFVEIPAKMIGPGLVEIPVGQMMNSNSPNIFTSFNPTIHKPYVNVENLGIGTYYFLFKE